MILVLVGETGSSNKRSYICGPTDLWKANEIATSLMDSLRGSIETVGPTELHNGADLLITVTTRQGSLDAVDDLVGGAIELLELRS